MLEMKKRLFARAGLLVNCRRASSSLQSSGVGSELDAKGFHNAEKGGKPGIAGGG
jgi:hypothetical protein